MLSVIDVKISPIKNYESFKMLHIICYYVRFFLKIPILGSYIIMYDIDIGNVKIIHDYSIFVM